MCKNTLCYFGVNFLKRHLKNRGSISLYWVLVEDTFYDEGVF